MSKPIKLSELVEMIQDTIEDRFMEEMFWIRTEITDVKKYPDKKWCFLKCIEKSGNSITTECRAVFWANSFFAINRFEHATKQPFSNGLEITCLVRISFHSRYGLTLEVLDIDATFTLGKLEIEKQQTLERLLSENPLEIQLIDEQYRTKNNSLELPTVIQKVALITAPGSDGRRDFIHELTNNPYGFSFDLTEYLTQIQGDLATSLIIKQLSSIEKSVEKFDAVVIARGGGSITDLKPFDDYELSLKVALFPVPVLTGIGHDRNISLVDLMARPLKTPTKVASYINEHNYQFENEILTLKEGFFNAVHHLLESKINDIENLKQNLSDGIQNYFNHKEKKIEELKRLIKNLNPASILSRGFAIIKMGEEIITDPDRIKTNSEIKVILKEEIIHSKVIQKEKYENEFDI